MFEWEGVCEFVAVVETESFTAAASRIGISTAQVSRQVSALEKRLSVKLFYRTTRRVSVTEMGKVYYHQCRQALDTLEEAERSVNQLQSTPRGSLRVTAPVTFGERMIAPLVNSFTARYPELKVQLHLTNKRLDLVEESYDLAIRLGKLSDSSMIAKRLMSRTLYVCASPDYLKTFGVPYSLSELEKHNCLLGTLDHWRLQEGGKSRSIRVAGNLRCNNGQALLDAALKHIGIVQLPDFYVLEYINNGRLVPLLENHREADEGVWAVYPHNRQLSLKVRMLMDYMSEALKA